MLDTNEVLTWRYLLDKGLTPYGAAGLMGNLYVESGFKPNNLENYGNKLLKMSDEEYTKQVQNGTYTKFVDDGLGYGLAQWTWWSRKEGLLKASKETKLPIDSLKLQLDYLYLELSTGYGNVLNVLKRARNVQEPTELVMKKFERPLDQSDNAVKNRINYSMDIYKRQVANDLKIKQHEINKTKFLKTKLVPENEHSTIIANKHY